MWKPLSHIIFIMCVFSSYSQQKEILGFIKSTREDPVPFANIIINSTGTPQKTLTYAYSDDEGRFSFKIPDTVQEISINVTSIGYQEKWVTFQTGQQPLVIYLEESVTQLSEVVVTARKVTDTLDINIHDMNLNKDSTLRDMLNKTDGVIIGEEGAISYQGKQISKVLINGKEVFVNQNKVALDNLNYEIMDNVHIIDNYKDKFTLDFKRIRDPVINIETKEEFKGILKIQFDVGYGFKDKYSLNGKGFFFSDILNAFATTHTNNTGEKELSQKDVSASVTKYSTSGLNNTLYPHFIEDYQTKKNFVSNSSLTLRWQGQNSKTGIVFYHGNMRTEREVDYSTFIAETLLKTSNLKNTEKGSFVSATANYSHILSPKMVLQNVLSTVGVGLRQFNQSADTLFIPEITSFMEQIKDAPQNFTISNALKLTRLISDNTAFNFDLDYYYEKNTRDFDTQLINSDAQDIFQQEAASKKYLLAQGNFNYRLRRATFNTGIALTKNNEDGNLKFLNNTHEDTQLKRDVITAEIPVSLSGSVKKIDYNFSATPTFIHTEKSKDRTFLTMAHSLTYNFEQQNNLSIGMGRSYRFYNLNALFDTIVRSYNQKIINHRENIDKYATRNEISISWFNNNVARSKSNHFIYRYNREEDFLQSVLDSISNNVFYYSNKVFDKKETHSVSSGYRKGFYLGKAYHLLNIGGGLDYTGNNYSTVVNNQSAQAKSNSWNPSLNLGFLPRNFFIKEVTNKVDWNRLTFWLDNEKINQQSVITNTFTVKGHGDKITWKFDFEYRFYDIDGDKFSVPDSNLSFKYDVSDKLSFSLTGRSLFTLFQLNNYNFVNTLSDGNTLTKIRTANNLGYLIFSTSLKF